MKKGRALGIVELILGILLILLGLFTFLHPSSVLGGIAAVYGAIALITGIADIVFYAKMERRTGLPSRSTGRQAIIWPEKESART